MKVYIIYDLTALRLQPLVRGVYLSLKKANEALERLTESSRAINDIFDNKIIKYTIKVMEANKDY